MPKASALSAFVVICRVENERGKTYKHRFFMHKAPCSPLLDPNIVISIQTQQLTTHV